MKVIFLLLLLGLGACSDRYRVKTVKGTPDVIWDEDHYKKPGDTIYQMRNVYVMDTFIVQGKY